MKTKKIYTRWIAYELRKAGFPIVNVEPNEHKPEFDTWDFEETTELNLAIKKIVANK